MAVDREQPGRSAAPRDGDETIGFNRDETSALSGDPQSPRRARTPHVHDLTQDGDPLPRRLGNYELLEEIGRGGMGVVYRARHVNLDRMVALKLLRGQTWHEDDAVRFVAEAQVTGQIEHPNIVPVHEVGTDERRRPYFVMKLVRGRALSEILIDLRKGEKTTQREYPLARLLNIFGEVCQAVAFAHSKGILHRDIKPSNVMIGDFGEVQLMDWGLAKKFDEPATRTAGLVNYDKNAPPKKVRADGSKVRTVRDVAPESQAGYVAGTPEYMSPEQASADPKALSPRSDIYSLGALLYEILSFRPPHIESDTRALLRKVATEQAVLPKPGGFRPKIDKFLKAVVMKAIALRPEDRYPTVLALLEDIRALQNDEPVRARPDHLGDRLLRKVRRHGPVLATLAAAMVVLAAGTGVALFFVQSAAEEQAREARAREKALALARQEADARAAAEGKRAEAEAARAKAEKDTRMAEAQFVEQANRLEQAVPVYLDALELLKRRRYNLALARLQHVIASNPFSPVAALAYFAKGEAYKMKGSHDDAREAILAFEAADAIAREANGIGDPRALLNCGDVAWRQLDDPKLALGYYQKAAAQDPVNPYAMMARAYAYILRAREASDEAQRRELAGRALLLAKRTASRGDFLWEAHYVAGTLYGGLELPGATAEDLDQAHRHFTKAISLEPNLPELWLSRARVARRMNDREGALADYATLLRMQPKAHEALSERGMMLLDAGKAEAALVDLDRALEGRPGDPGLLLARGKALLKLGATGEAEAAFGKLISALELLVLPDGASLHEAFYRRGLARLKLGRPAEAAVDAEAALKHGPGDLSTLQLRAEARLKAGQFAEAVEDYTELIDQAPGFVEARKLKGDALKAQGMVREALAMYDDFLTHKPERLDVRLMVVQLRLADPRAPWFDPERALADAREAEKTARYKDPKVMMALADALMAGQKTQEALAVAERAYTLFPTDPEVQEGRDRLKREAEARQKEPRRR